MPKRLDIREGGALEIGGVPVALSFARDRHAVLEVGVYDADGLLETVDDCKRSARRFLDKLDSGPKNRNDAP